MAADPIASKSDPLRFIRQFTARKPYLLGEAIVGGIAVFAGIASFADWGIQVARGWLAIFGGLLVALLVIAKIAGDRVRDAQVEADRQLVVDIHKAVVQAPAIPAMPIAQIGNVYTAIDHQRDLRTSDEEARYWSTRQTMDMLREEVKRATPPPEPDVSLRFELPNHFELHNYGGDAVNVSIATVTIDEYIPYPTEMPKSRVPEQTVMFPTVDVDAGATTRVSPVFTYLVTVATTMAKFIEASIERRHVTRSVAPLPEDATPLETRQHQQQVWRLRDEPVEMELRLSYEGRATGRKWEKVETLHYNPVTSIAHVIHGVPAEITSARQGTTQNAPDVTLEGTFPGTFSLYARGHACEIRTGPIVTESAIYGTMKDGERVMRTMMPRHALEFAVISDLHDGEKKEIMPSLLFGEDDPRHRRSAWPEDIAKKPALEQFLYNATFLRSRENVEPDFDTISRAELDALAERRSQPFHFPFDITFWDSEHRQQWKRSEVLVYEPATNRAFVRHTGRPERVVAG